MRKGFATLFLGLTVGIVGAFVYNRLKNEQMEQDAEALLDKLNDQLVRLEEAKKAAEA